MKGSSIHHMQAFVVERFGHSGWTAQLSALTRSDRRVVSSALPGGWYDLSLHARLNQSFCSHFRNGSLSIAHELGRFSAERDFRDAHRWLLRLVDPSFLLRNLDVYWRRAHDSGRWQAWMHGSMVIAQLHGWVAEATLCHRVAGYLQRALEFAGRSLSFEHSQCTARGDARCEFRAHWQGGQPEGRAGQLTDRDILDASLEIIQCRDTDTLASVLGRIIQEELGSSAAELRLFTNSIADSNLALRIGHSVGKEQHRFALLAGGREVGQLDVHARLDARSRSALQTLERLLPYFAAAFDSTRAIGTDAAQRPTTAQDLQRRLRNGATCWSLDMREQEVMRRLAMGRTNKEIALDIGCQEGTVEVYVSRILRKSRAENRTMLVARFWSEL